MPIRPPIFKEDPANAAMDSLVTAGIDIEGLRPFAESFPNDYYAILSILAREGFAVLKALGIRIVESTWRDSHQVGHTFYISDKDFTTGGIRNIVQKLRDDAAQRGISVKPLSDITDTIAKKVSATTRPRSQREAFAAWFIQRFWPGRDFRPQAVNSHGATFNVMNGGGKYAGYSIEISNRPPFKVRILQMKRVNGRWVGKEIFRKTFQPRT